MTRRRIIFYSIFGGYQLLAFIFTLVMDRFLLDIVGYLTWFKYLAFLGLAMVVVDFVWWWMEKRSNEKEQESMRQENNTLKAKVYDLQESGKGKPEIPTPK